MFGVVSKYLSDFVMLSEKNGSRFLGNIGTGSNESLKVPVRHHKSCQLFPQKSLNIDV